MRDFHTHDLTTPLRALISTTGEAAPGKLCSLQYHPWDVPADFAELPENFALRAAGFTAIGEAGLDKLRGAPPAQQVAALQKIFLLARELKKPVVCHIVKMYDEFFALRKQFPELKIMVHGFRGKAELLAQLWRSGITVSFHHDILRRPELLAMLHDPAGSFGFESDDNTLSLPEIISCAAAAAGNPQLEKISDRHFEAFVS